MNCSAVLKESRFAGKHTSLYLASWKASTKSETFYIWSNESLSKLP